MSASSRAARPILATALALLAGVLFLLPTTARAEGGVPIPAEAGTTWSIVAGYNTGTHSEADGQDPHAIDIVRVPSVETAFSLVLAPVSGTVAWRRWDGLSITDSAGFDHLLAHVSPFDRIQRGTVVNVGDQIARVCLAYECGNYGLPHIHYAVHESRGGGHLGPSVPFTGNYAIEGRDLYYTPEYNLHAGIEFTSTNVPGWTPPASTVDPDPNPGDDDSRTGPGTQDSEADSAPAWSIPDDAPVGGWRAISVNRQTSVAGLFAQLGSPLLEFVVHNPFLDSYHRFDPDDPGSAQIAVRSLPPGHAVWALVEPGARWLPPPPAAAQQVTIRLAAGVNMVSWQGPDRDIADALRNVAHLDRAYRYDPRSDSWTLYIPAAPSFLNTLGTLKSGDAFHLVVRAGSMWTQLP